MTRLEEQSKTREQNAQYLTKQLREIPGILPARMYDGCTRNAYHLYMLRYQPERFAGPAAGEVPPGAAGRGHPLLRRLLAAEQGVVRLATRSRARPTSGSTPPEVAGRWEERTRCPANDRLCEEAVWFTQTMLLGPRHDMDDIVAAIAEDPHLRGRPREGVRRCVRSVIRLGVCLGAIACFQTDSVQAAAGFRAGLGQGQDHTRSAHLDVRLRSAKPCLRRRDAGSLGQGPGLGRRQGQQGRARHRRPDRPPAGHLGRGRGSGWRRSTGSSGRSSC